MKVAVIGTRGFPGIQGGVEKHCEALCRALPDSVELTVYRRRPYLSGASSDSLSGIRFVDLPSTRIKGFETVLHSFLASVCASFSKDDIVHFHNIGPAAFSPLVKLFGKKVVLTYHSANYEHDKWGAVSKKLLKLAERIALKSADRIIFINQFRMMTFGPEVLRKSVYIPNGAPEAASSDKTDFVESLNLTPGNYMLSVGRITPEKGYEYLIEACRRLGSSCPLVIAGDVESERSYGKELHSLSLGCNIVFAGTVGGENLRQLYSHARIFVLPSVTEGFPLVLLEAMAYGLDIIASDIPATRLVQLPEDDYVPPRDVPALKDKIEARLAAPARACHYELKDFRWDDIAQKVYDNYLMANDHTC